MQTFTYISGPNQEHIATMNYDPKVHDLCQANARIVIAAPELLKALRLVHNKVLSEYHDRRSPVRQAVEAAIAKATGDDA
jgi:hypothetical protein